MKKYSLSIFFLVILSLAIIFGIFFSSYENIFYKGTSDVEVNIPFGASIWDISKILKENRLISSPYIFVFGSWREGLQGKFHSGTFQIPPYLSARDIAYILVNEDGDPKRKDIRITFPEGWTAQKMADRLDANNLPGDEFIEAFRSPKLFFSEYAFLEIIPEGGTLEGFLFPDTYFFDPESNGEMLIRTMLEAFEQKVIPIIGQLDADRYPTIIMASIIEGEVRTKEDRRVVSGIFQKRLQAGMALQSDATLTYVLDEKMIQHGAEELATDSLYNTYKYPGLPPGPVSNPSLDAIEAALFPQDSPFFYFLSDPKTGMTYFSQDFDGHKKNKIRVGL